MVQLAAIDALIEGNPDYVMVLSHRGLEAVRFSEIDEYAADLVKEDGESE